MGIHAYSLAAVASAFLTGSFLAGELMETQAQMHYHDLGKKTSALILDRFVPSEGPIQRSFVSNQYWDQAADVSLLGLIRPFSILPRDHPSAKRLVELVRSRLWWNSTGGVLRYEGDTYRGGNPWILTTLWLGYVEMTLGNWSEARETFQWSMAKSTPLGLFPEQVHKESGKPYWVIPLGWSHAMFLLFVEEVLRRKCESRIWD
jgi:hypothetical protein